MQHGRKCTQSLYKTLRVSKKDEILEDMACKIVKLVEQFELEVGAADVELLHTREPELTNEEFRYLEETKATEHEEAEGKPVEELQQFIFEEMATVYHDIHDISSALARLEKMDPKLIAILKVQREIDEMLACYTKLYKERRKIHCPVNS